MTPPDKLTLTDARGLPHDFWIYAITDPLPTVAGVYYVYAQAITGSGPDSRIPVYIGQTEDASTCIDVHRRQILRANGGTHVALHVDSSEGSRLLKVDYLVRALKPPCNG